jgi:4-methyl-5(b-hydroxyethyl)-thiazole monophosphate biosynthesis
MVYIHLCDGFEEIEALTVVDVLRRADVEVKTVSLNGYEYVESVHNIIVRSDLCFEDADYDNCSMIVLPGGIPGTEKLRNHKGLRKQLINFSEQGKFIAAICAAPTILGNLGILKGRKATSYPGMEDQLFGAIHFSDSVVIDGNLITSKGPGTAFEFGLAILRIIKGEEEENAVRAKILL